VLAKVSVPVLHSAVAILKLTEMGFCGEPTLTLTLTLTLTPNPDPDSNPDPNPNPNPNPDPDPDQVGAARRLRGGGRHHRLDSGIPCFWR
jgi:hypothetical protein